MPALHISDSLSLPPRTVGETIAVLGVRGSGKSYGASVLTEEMLAAGVPVVVIDPLDAWHGLRSSADGTAEGLPVVIAGGSHSDVPLEAGMGRLLADVVVEQGLSMVLSLRHLSKTKQRRLVLDFCVRLYERKGEDQHRTSLHVVIDEADAFVPQRVAGDTAQVMGAVDDLVRRGRSSGIGVTLITQRPAVLHKDVLSQAGTLLAFRVSAPQDRKALDEWIQANDRHNHRKPFLDSLASLPTGTCWVWAPEHGDVFQQVRIRARHTFDSSATPEPGQEAVVPQAFARVDLEALRELLERADAVATDDPIALKRRVAELERQLRERPAPEPVIVEVPIITAENEIVLRDVVAQLTDHGAQVYGIRNDLLALLDRTPSTPVQAASAPMPRQTPFVAASGQPAPVASRERTADVRSVATDDRHLKKGERLILQWLVRMGPLTKTQIGLLTDYAHKGGTFRTYTSTLRRAGFIAEEGDTFSATDAGAAYLDGDVLPAPTSLTEVLDLYMVALKAGERAMLARVIDAWSGITKEELGADTGYTATGGTFRTYLSVLRRAGLVEERDDELVPGPALWPAVMAGAA